MTDQTIITFTPASEIELDPALKGVREPLITEWELAAARVAAEFGERDPNLLADSGRTPEELIKARFDITPGDAKGNACAKAIRELGQPAHPEQGNEDFQSPGRKRGGELSSKGHIDTVNAVAPKVITDQEITDIANNLLSDLGFRRPPDRSRSNDQSDAATSPAIPGRWTRNRLPSGSGQ